MFESRRSRRFVVVGLLVGSLAAGVAGVVRAGPRRLARGVHFACRITTKRSRDLPSDLVLLGATRMPWARVILESHLHAKNAEVRAGAMRGLVRGFPDSEVAVACAEFSRITGESYFCDGWTKVTSRAHQYGKWERAHHLAEQASARIDAWERFLITTPDDFPGKDDACYWLGRDYETLGRPREAFRVLERTFATGDRDCTRLASDAIASVLDAECSIEDVRELLEDEREVGWRGLLGYSLAVKLAQARRFADAVAALEASAGDFSDERLALRPYASCRSKDCRHTFLADVARQRESWSELARLADARREAAGARTRAWALESSGEHALAEPHAFENLILHEQVREHRFGHAPRLPECAACARSWNADPTDDVDRRMRDYVLARSHVVQAARFFEEAASEEPSGRRAARAAMRAAVIRIRLAGDFGWLRDKGSYCAGHEVSGGRSACSLKLDAARAVRAAAAIVGRDGVLALALQQELSCEAYASFADTGDRRGSRTIRELLAHLDQAERGAKDGTPKAPIGASSPLRKSFGR